jgi:hypothetical protein
LSFTHLFQLNILHVRPYLSKGSLSPHMSGSVKILILSD